MVLTSSIFLLQDTVKFVRSNISCDFINLWNLAGLLDSLHPEKDYISLSRNDISVSMADKKISISVPEEVDAALRALSISKGLNKSKLIENLLRNNEQIARFIRAGKADEGGGVYAVPASKEKYRLQGYDTFGGEWYTLPNSYNTESEAEEAAREKLKEIERLQPSSSSGGQYPTGIQDRFYIVYPDGTKRRILPKKM